MSCMPNIGTIQQVLHNPCTSITTWRIAIFSSMLFAFIRFVVLRLIFAVIHLR